MKRALMLALMMTFLCACGRGENTQERFRTWRENLAEAEEICFSLDETVDMEDEVFKCVLDCARRPDSLRVTIREPEELRGISADICRGTMEYDGVELYVGELPKDLSPMGSAGQVVHALLDAFVQETYQEQKGEILAVRTYLDEESDVTVRFDSATMTPVSADIVRNGKTVISCGISNFSAE